MTGGGALKEKFNDTGLTESSAPPRTNISLISPQGNRSLLFDRYNSSADRKTAGLYRSASAGRVVTGAWAEFVFQDFPGFVLSAYEQCE